jgi:ATP-binding protein involved in chromosome partitioning
MSNEANSLPTPEQLNSALSNVIDPELRKDIVELGMVRSAVVHPNGVVDVTVSLTTAGCPIRGHFENAVREHVGGLPGVTGVNLSFDVLSPEEKAGLQKKLGRAGLPAGALAQVGRVICVASGKGGVGKSTLTANLAAALSAEGRRVGVLDADVWGYSQPRMFGLGAGRPKVNAERKIIPHEAHGIKVMSIGFFLEEDAAVVWRGPMLHKALTQFLEDVAWGEIDDLLVGRRLDDDCQPSARFRVRAGDHSSARCPAGRQAIRRHGRQGRDLDRRSDREHGRLRYAGRRAL